MFTATAFAQQPAHIRGQIEKADGAMLALSEVQEHAPNGPWSKRRPSK